MTRQYQHQQQHRHRHHDICRGRGARLGHANNNNNDGDNRTNATARRAFAAAQDHHGTPGHRRGHRRRACVRALRPVCRAILGETLARKLAADSIKHSTMAATVAANAKAVKAIQKQLTTTASSSSSSSSSQSHSKSQSHSRSARAAVDLFLQLPDVKQHSAAYLDAILRAGYRQQTIALADALRFLRGLPNPEHQLNGCWLLHEVDVAAAATASEHRQVRLALAFFVCELKQKLQSSPLKIRVDQFWRDWYTPGVRALVLGHGVTLEAFASTSVVAATGACSIGSAGFSMGDNNSTTSSSNGDSVADNDGDNATEVMCAAPDALKFDDLRRRLFTCKRRVVSGSGSDGATDTTVGSPVDTPGSDATTQSHEGAADALASQWRFVPGDADKTWFHIVNARHTGEFVYAAIVKVDDAQSLAQDYAFMWCGGSPDAQCEWELRFCGGRDVFELYCPDRCAFLFASPDQRVDSERRLVLALDAADTTSKHAVARQWRITA